MAFHIRSLCRVLVAAVVLAPGLQPNSSAAEPCATLASAPFGLTIRYASGERAVVTNRGDQQSRIDTFSSDGTSLGSDFTIAGAFAVESVAGNGRASVAIERSPAAETMLPFTQGAEETFDLIYRRRGEPVLYVEATIHVLETGSIHLPAANCDLDVALLRYHTRVGSGVGTTHTINAPSLRAALVIDGPARLADVDPNDLPVAIERNSTRPADRRELLLMQPRSKFLPWLSDLDQCPADLLPREVVALDYYPKRCVAFPEQCLDSCKSGDADSCYSAALAFQELRDSPLSEALFLHACSLGVVSGCVNRAAAMPEADARCQVRTFEMACSLDNPWGCTMLGAHALRGLGMTADVPRARRALEAACAIDPSDQPCFYARKLLESAH